MRIAGRFCPLGYLSFIFNFNMFGYYPSKYLTVKQFHNLAATVYRHKVHKVPINQSELFDKIESDNLIIEFPITYSIYVDDIVLFYELWSITAFKPYRLPIQKYFIVESIIIDNNKQFCKLGVYPYV